MSAPIEITIDAKSGFETVARKIARMPRQAEKAQNRAVRKLATWVKRQAAKSVAAAVGTTQAQIMEILRLRVKGPGKGPTDGSRLIWIGTNPIKVQYLGAVRWTRSMPGAMAGDLLFPGSWSWGPGSKTGSAVMRRSGGFYYRRTAAGNARIFNATLRRHYPNVASELLKPERNGRGVTKREGIAEVKQDIHPIVYAHMASIIPRIEDRFERLLRQELNYALNVEARR